MNASIEIPTRPPRDEALYSCGEFMAHLGAIGVLILLAISVTRALDKYGRGHRNRRLCPRSGDGPLVRALRRTGELQ